MLKLRQNDATVYAYSLGYPQIYLSQFATTIERTMILQDFHHVAIIASDYQRSKRFYVDILGCIVLQETYRTARDSYKLDLRVGKQSQIELFSFPEPPPRPNAPEAMGLRHLAFRVDDLDASVAYLVAQGVDVEPIRIDDLTHKRFTFFKDPDGLPLELYEN